MSTTSPSNTPSKSKKQKKSKAGYIVAGVATAAVVGVGIYFLSGTASAKTNSGEPKAKPKGSGSTTPPRTAKDGAKTPGQKPSGANGADGADQGGSAGPGGNLPSGGSASKGSGKGSGKSSGGKSNGKAPKDAPAPSEGGQDDVPMGFFWGDRTKIPADFDFRSNRIWISPDRTAAAAGFYFFMDGTDANGDRVTWDEDGLSFLISDGSVLAPTKDRDHREDPVPSLRKILTMKDPQTGEPRRDSVFSWLAAYYGTAISPLEAATSEGVGLLQDMVDEASVINGGGKQAINLNGPLRDFYGYALGRLEMGRRAIYGEFRWGEGEEAVG